MSSSQEGKSLKMREKDAEVEDEEEADIKERKRSKFTVRLLAPLPFMSRSISEPKRSELKSQRNSS